MAKRSPLPSVSKSEALRWTSATAEAASARTKALKAAPGPDDLRKDAKARIEYKQNGDWVAHVPPSHMKKAVDMMKGTRREKSERGAVLQSRQQREKVVNGAGQVVELVSETIDAVKHRGLRPVGRGGRSAALYFDMASATERYVRGPDGLDFVWNDGWEPAPLFTPKAESPQRDPDGNVWVKHEDEWVLDSEVE